MIPQGRDLNVTPGPFRGPVPGICQCAAATGPRRARTVKVARATAAAAALSAQRLRHTVTGRSAAPLRVARRRRAAIIISDPGTSDSPRRRRAGGFRRADSPRLAAPSRPQPDTGRSVAAATAGPRPGRRRHAVT